MMLERFPEVKKLSPAEKLQLATELWDELEAHPEGTPVSPEILAELDRRMEDFEGNPTEFTTWEEAKARILARK